MIRVLMAEDHALVREGTRALLEQGDDISVVAEAADGEAAVEAVARWQPDLVLMDIAMPRCNGVEAIRRIKESHAHTRIIVLTAHDDDAYVFAALEAGAAGYLLKSVRSDDLLGAVRAVHSGECVLAPAIARKVLGRFINGQNGDGGSIDEMKSDLLTERERSVLRLAARGMTNKAIANELSLSPRTVQIHLGHIFGKLGVASRTEAVTAGLRHGWLHLEDVA